MEMVGWRRKGKEAIKTSNKWPRVPFSVNEPGSYTQVTLLIPSPVEIRMLIKAEVGMCYGRSNFGISIEGQA